MSPTSLHLVERKRKKKCISSSEDLTSDRAAQKGHGCLEFRRKHCNLVRRHGGEHAVSPSSTGCVFHPVTVVCRSGRSECQLGCSLPLWAKNVTALLNYSSRRECSQHLLHSVPACLVFSMRALQKKHVLWLKNKRRNKQDSSTGKDASR